VAILWMKMKIKLDLLGQEEKQSKKLNSSKGLDSSSKLHPLLAEIDNTV
jgi:hypothetical protein